MAYGYWRNSAEERDYWKNRADELVRESAGRLKETDELWRRLVTVEQNAARARVAFDWLAKRIRLRNSSAFKRDTIAKAREIVAARRADAELSPAPRAGAS